jgi:signal peptide peptidase SppA
MTPAALRHSLLNVPLALHAPFAPGGQPVALPQALQALGLAEPAQAAPQLAAYGMAADAPDQRAYDVVDGVAVIAVHGTLVQALGSAWSWGWVTGYDGIRHNMRQALADPEVAALALHIDSPGGHVAGCFDLADAIFAARGSKPMVAILAETAFSAAYAIASACDRIVVPRTGGTGSIGVIALLCEYSAMLEQAGIAVNILQYGDRKADGNPYQPLQKAARDRFQAQIDAMGELFVATVARNRGLQPAAVRALQAATFMGAEGVAVGLADAVMSPEDAFAGLVAAIG